MTVETLLRLALVPTAVWLASLAARRWGHAVSGYLGGLPMIGGPITLFLALDIGPAFAARSALFTLAAIVGQAAHLLAFACAARSGRWALSLAAGWAAFAAASITVSMLPLQPPLALALAVAALAAAARWLPREKGPTVAPRIPPIELRLRVLAAFALAALILWSAPVFGPAVSGVLLSVPVTGSIMPPFTLALYGYDALARLLRGFVVGLSGFTAFFAALALGLGTWGIVPVFVAALALALATVFAVDRAARWRKS
ncbi:MAG TPA: hypothetical protein VFP36_02365 [Usitatibacter sp.]|nr:hypothetical protein [Usitatibacter sp.]